MNREKEKHMRKVCIMGLGYIGLPTASFLATKGFQVHGVDVKPEIVEALQKGSTTIEEPSLDVLVKSATASGRLTAGYTPQPADIFILSVPTPFDCGHKPDLAYVFQALEAVAPLAEPGNLLILESTVPVGTTAAVAARLAMLRPDLCVGGQCDASDGKEVCVAHCPERVLPGHILHELVQNDRIVGGVDELSTRRCVEFYKSFVQGAVQGTDAGTAEMVKLAENSFRDVNIAYANELAQLCEKLNLDVWNVIQMANRHPRVNILRPGPGVGGHCIAVDPWFLVDSAPDIARLVRTAREVNDAKPQNVIDKVLNAASCYDNPVIACLGLAFKPDVDDMRQSPALAITEAVAAQSSGQILVCEPHLLCLPEKLATFPHVRKVSLDEAIARADIILALVSHKAFHGISREELGNRTIVDTCGLWHNTASH